MYSALSTFNTTTDVPLSKEPNPQLLHGSRSINALLRVCVCVCVCVRVRVRVCTLDGLNTEHKFRVWVIILGCMSRHFYLRIILLFIFNFLIINFNFIWAGTPTHIFFRELLRYINILLLSINI